MAIDTNPFGEKSVKTLTRLDIPVDLWRRIQALQATAGEDGEPKSFVEALVMALERGLDELAPALRLSTDGPTKPRTYGEHLAARAAATRAQEVSIEVLHDGVEATHADAPVIEDAEFEDVVKP